MVPGEGFEPPKAYTGRFTVCSLWPLGHPGKGPSGLGRTSYYVLRSPKPNMGRGADDRLAHRTETKASASTTTITGTGPDPPATARATGYVVRRTAAAEQPLPLHDPHRHLLEAGDTIWDRRVGAEHAAESAAARAAPPAECLERVGNEELRHCRIDVHWHLCGATFELRQGTRQCEGRSSRERAGSVCLVLTGTG